MGAWGVGNFENDAALDWLAGVAAPDQVRGALSSVVNAQPGGVECDAACAALAAAEIVAACCGSPASSLPQAARLWVSGHRSTCRLPEVDLASRAVVRVELDSELQELFDEGGRNVQWHAALAELGARLERCRALFGLN
jgi:hypothetical protein